MSDNTTDLLGFADLERVADFLLHHMSQQTRGKLMAELPVAYAKLYPGVDSAIIIDHVAHAIDGARADRLARSARERDMAAGTPEGRTRDALRSRGLLDDADQRAADAESDAINDAAGSARDARAARERSLIPGYGVGTCQVCGKPVKRADGPTPQPLIHVTPTCETNDSAHAPVLA
jgi:hypothetical protein